MGSTISKILTTSIDLACRARLVGQTLQIPDIAHSRHCKIQRLQDPGTDKQKIYPAGLKSLGGCLCVLTLKV